MPQLVLVLIKTAPTQKQKGKGHMNQVTSRPQKVFTAVNSVIVDLDIGNRSHPPPQNHPTTSLPPPLPHSNTNLSLVDTSSLGRAPDTHPINILTYHEIARNSEVSHPLPQGQGVVRAKDRSNSPSRGRLVAGKAKHEDKAQRSICRRNRTTPGSAKTDSDPKTQLN